MQILIPIFFFAVIKNASMYFVGSSQTGRVPGGSSQTGSQVGGKLIKNCNLCTASSPTY